MIPEKRGVCLEVVLQATGVDGSAAQWVLSDAGCWQWAGTTGRSASLATWRGRTLCALGTQGWWAAPRRLYSVKRCVCSCMCVCPCMCMCKLCLNVCLCFVHVCISAFVCTPLCAYVCCVCMGPHPLRPVKMCFDAIVNWYEVASRCLRIFPPLWKVIRSISCLCGCECLSLIFSKSLSHLSPVHHLIV